GVWLTGSVLVDGSHLDGIVKVTAPAGRPAGRVAFFGTKIVARLGGRTVRTTIGHVLRTRLARAPARPAASSAFRLP
ncbi:MAG: hypothetical protein JWM73_781, partial [Solirubrobacterales bacterium]|nr:hypothetical protein [Solirubrobacterales bacterium]